MQNHVMLEGLESRNLMSAVFAAAAKVQVIGPTTGLTAAASVPTFKNLTTQNVDSSVNTSNTGVSRDTSIQIQFTRGSSGTGIDASNLSRGAVQITNLRTGVVYNAVSPANTTAGPNIRTLLRKVSTSGGGDVLVIVPTGLWDANTTYKVEVNGSYTPSGEKIKDVSGATFAAFGSSTTTFTTGANYPQPSPPIRNSVSFAQTVVTNGTTQNRPYIATTIGPDHRLYTATSAGYIYRYDINSNGTLSNEFEIDTIRTNNGGGRIITGIVFDPSSTAGNLVMWVSHGQQAFGNNPNGSDPVEQYANNFTGKISRISGANLQNYQDIVVGIPRSVKDHMNDQLVFDPKGKSVYFCIAAMNAMGAADSTWGNRVENVYSATIMQLKLAALHDYLPASGAINLAIDGNQNTADGLTPGTLHYNIFRGSNPLRIYADGIRNSFDMVWAANGHLYAMINGSSAGGATPGTPSDLSTVPTANRPDKDTVANGLTYSGPRVAAVANVNQVEPDSIYDVINGKYYGHPNPARGEYVLDAGNTGGSATDGYQFRDLPAHTQPDRSYTRPAYSFGNNYSPDGVIQYKAVGGKNTAIDNYLLVARYSSGSDILALKTESNGTISATEPRIKGLSGLESPLDIVEDMQTGNLYVTELKGENSQGQIRLLKAVSGTGGGTTIGGTPSLNKTKQGFFVKPGSTTGATQTVTLTNTGTGTGTGSITIDRSATRISSRLYRKNFVITNLPADDLVLQAGQSYQFSVKGVLAKGQTGTPYTVLAIHVLNTAGGSVYETVNLRAYDAATVTTQSYTPPARSSVFAAAQPAAGQSLIRQLDLDLV